MALNFDAPPVAQSEPLATQTVRLKVVCVSAVIFAFNWFIIAVYVVSTFKAVCWCA